MNTSQAASIVLAASVFIAARSVADQMLDAPGLGYRQQAIQFSLPLPSVIYTRKAASLWLFDDTPKGSFMHSAAFPLNRLIVLGQSDSNVQLVNPRIEDARYHGNLEAPGK